MSVAALAPVEHKTYTADELFKLSIPDRRTELVRGELVIMDPSGGEHGEISSAVAALLRPFIKQHQLGRAYGAETGFILSRNPDTVRAPDFAFISNERLPQAAPIKGFIPLAPDLAVEIVSPNDTAREIAAKVREYLDAGTRMVWVIEPELRTVTVYRSLTNIRMFTANDKLSGEDVLAGFSCNVSELFE
ncbi:MAG: Uma2 family endonuclease [Chloroflexi bacterium]|nr:Uma2 family endonuclease [Chloroflexota bacterium]